MKVNINDTAWVKLSDEGFRFHKERWAPIYAKIESNYEPPAVDDEGYCKFQLWELMNTFGPHMNLGRVPPFATDILFKNARAQL